MDIKKTDVFSGIGVFTIQMIANGIWYAFQKNKIFFLVRKSKESKGEKRKMKINREKAMPFRIERKGKDTS